MSTLVGSRIVSANGVFFVTLDKAAFLTKVQKYLDISPVVKEWNDVKALSWPAALKPPQLWDSIKQIQDVISVVTSAVEVAKQAVIKEQDPDGSKGLKFDKEVALHAAVEIVCSYIKFNGVIGSILSKIWTPLLNVIISIYINQQPIGDWLAIALNILKIAGVAL